MPDLFNIPRLDISDATFSIEKIALAMDTISPVSIDHLLWSENGYRPHAEARLAYNDDHIFLKFNVRENVIKASYNYINGPVYKDSCVEFFISFNDDAKYYNFEFNCLGNCLVSYGAGKPGRALLSEGLVNEITTHAVVNKPGTDYRFSWSLTIRIPLKIFIYNANLKLKGSNCRLNLYKCGDELPLPHYLSWTNIVSETPNFHLPQFFSNGRFV